MVYSLISTKEWGTKLINEFTPFCLKLTLMCESTLLRVGSSNATRHTNNQKAMLMDASLFSSSSPLME